MPRTTMDLGLKVERLSVLDEEAAVDAALDPNVPQEDLKRILGTMVLARVFDDRRLKLQRQGRIGTFAPATGQEAAQVGSAYVLETEDWMVPSFRETPAGIWRGADLVNDLMYCAGFDEGISIPSTSHDLPICIPVASQVPHAVGLGWGLKRQKSDRVVLCYFGDGATSEGDFHEGLNFASLQQVPVVFFCQNNQWAISVPRREQTHSRTLAQKALAYDIPAIVVDGNDVLAVIAATREAVARARQGRGPTFIEAVTYRMGVHTTADDPSLYRGKGEVEEWARRDPIQRLQRYMAEKDWLADGEMDALQEKASQRVDAAVQAFEERRRTLDPVRMFDHLYSQPTRDLTRQKEMLLDRVKRKRPASEPESGEAHASESETDEKKEQRQSPEKEEQSTETPQEESRGDKGSPAGRTPRQRASRSRRPRQRSKKDEATEEPADAEQTPPRGESGGPA